MKNNTMYIIICLFLVVLASGTTFVIVKYSNKNEVKKNDELKNDIIQNDRVKFLDIKNNGNKIVEEFEVTLNGKTNTLKIEFSYNSEKDEFDKEDYQEVVGKFNNDLVYSVAGYGEPLSIKKRYYETNLLKTTFNESNFKIIKGNDNKNYLLIISNNKSGMYVPPSDYLYIYDDNLSLIETLDIRNGSVGFELENNAYPWYTDQFNVCGELSICHIRVKIENNNIYYLDDVLSDGQYVKIEEKMCSLNNSKLEQKVLNTYNIVGPAYGQA